MMNKKMLNMMKGDYILHNGKVVKITNTNYYDVADTTGNEEKNVVLHMPNIIINEGVLEAIGFIQSQENKYIYSYYIGNKKLAIIGDIMFDLSPLKKICDIAFSLQADSMRISKQIIVLSELQDFIRINTNQELPIDIEKLVAAIK